MRHTPSPTAGCRFERRFGLKYVIMAILLVLLALVTNTHQSPGPYQTPPSATDMPKDEVSAPVRPSPINECKEVDVGEFATDLPTPTLTIQLTAGETRSVANHYGHVQAVANDDSPLSKWFCLDNTGEDGFWEWRDLSGRVFMTYDGSTVKALRTARFLAW